MNEATLEWLLDSDPAIRWQVMRDVAAEPADVVAAERSRVGVEGWGAELLALQDDDGRWDGGTYRPGWADESKPFFDAWCVAHGYEHLPVVPVHADVCRHDLLFELELDAGAPVS